MSRAAFCTAWLVLCIWGEGLPFFLQLLSRFFSASLIQSLLFINIYIYIYTYRERERELLFIELCLEPP